jgi:hypothetical protein
MMIKAQHQQAVRLASSSRTARPQPLHHSRRALAPPARAVPAEAAAAVAQQAIAFAAVLAGEAAFSRTQVPASDPGSPSVPVVAGGVAGSVGAALLLKAGAGSVGVVVGLVSSGAMVAASVLRALRLQAENDDWPGYKAWPLGMALISFFALMSFVQTAFLPSTPVV